MGADLSIKVAVMGPICYIYYRQLAQNKTAKLHSFSKQYARAGMGYYK